MRELWERIKFSWRLWCINRHMARIARSHRIAWPEQ